MASQLPSSVPTPVALTTATKTAVLPLFGPEEGWYDHGIRVNLPPVGVTAEVLFHTVPAGNLPNGTLTSVAMTTSTKSLVLGGAGGALGRKYYIAYASNSAQANSFSCVGNVNLTVSLPQPPGFSVVGRVRLAIGDVGGVSTVNGSFRCVGNVSLKTTFVTANSFSVVGNVNLQIAQYQGQQETCISGSATPNVALPNQVK